MGKLGVLYAVESLVPPRGGAERMTLDMLEALAARHDVTAVCLEDGPYDPVPRVTLRSVAPPPPATGYWANKRVRREAVAAAVRAELARSGADVVATSLHAGPGAVAAAAEAGVPAVVFLHSYEPLCKYAFDFGSDCVPASGCVDCPRARALPAEERAELVASRSAHAASLRAAAALVAPSHAMADAVEAWCGRRPVVVPGSVRDLPPARAAIDGPVVLAAARWRPDKGSGLIEPLADLLGHRTLAVTTDGLDAETAERLRARPNVRLVPNGPIGEVLDGAAALLVPSRWQEPFGRTAFEGMAAGIPTLASAVGGMREFVPEAQLVEPPAEPRRWFEAVEALLEPASWEAARRRGRAAAEAVLATDPVGMVETVLTEAGR